MLIASPHLQALCHLSSMDIALENFYTSFQLKIDVLNSRLGFAAERLELGSGLTKALQRKLNRLDAEKKVLEVELNTVHKDRKLLLSQLMKKDESQQ